MPELIKTQAIVLHSIRWQESSKIVTLYSREHGKIKVIARGALRSKSPFGGKLETLNLIEAIISTKVSRSLQILTQADLLNSFNSIRPDLARLPFALSILEIIYQALDEHQVDEIFFDFVITLLEAISQSAQAEIILWYFLLKFTSFLGFKPNFDYCASCSNTALKGAVHFAIEKGAIYCNECSSANASNISLRNDELEFLRRLQNHPHRRLNEWVTPVPAKRDFTSLLIDYLNHHLEHSLSLNSLSMLAR